MLSNDPTDKQIEAMGRDELIEAQAGLVVEMDKIKDQLANARVRVAKTGEYSDSDWYQQSVRAQKAMGRKHQLMLQRLSVVNRAERKTKQKEQKADEPTFDRAFKHQAKAMLPRSKYWEIIEETNAWLAVRKERGMSSTTDVDVDEDVIPGPDHIVRTLQKRIDEIKTLPRKENQKAVTPKPCRSPQADKPGKDPLVGLKKGKDRIL